MESRPVGARGWVPANRPRGALVGEEHVLKLIAVMAAQLLNTLKTAALCNLNW